MDESNEMQVSYFIMLVKNNFILDLFQDKLLWNKCLNISNISVINSTIIFLFEPLHSLILADSMFSTDSAFASSSKANSASWSLKDDIEIHTKNTSKGVIFNTQINMLLDPKTETARIRKISFLELSILDLKSSLKNLISLITSDGDMDSNLFISLNAKTSDSVSSS